MESNNTIVTEQPAQGQPVQEPAQGQPVQEPAQGQPVQELAQGQPVQELAQGQPVQEPAQGQPVQGDASQVPTSGGGAKSLSFIRASGGWTDIFIVAVGLSVLVAVLGEFVSMLFTQQLFSAHDWLMKFIPNEDAVTFLLQYFSPFGEWIVFLFLVIIFKRNRPMWKAFFYNGHGNNLGAIFAGILLGGGMNGACIFMSWLRGDIVLSFNEFNPLLFFAFLICVMFQSGAEEIVDRCYLYQKLRRRYRWPAVAIIVNSLTFMALHMFNPGVTKLGLLQIFEIGFLFSLIIYYYDSLWTAIWAHTAWNFSQSIVFGLPNSGIVSMYSVFRLDAASARDGLFYNTSFGVEGSPGACAVIAAVTVLLLLYALIMRRGERVDYWKDMEEEAMVKGKESRPWEWVMWAVVIIALFAALIGISIMRNPELLENIRW